MIFDSGTDKSGSDSGGNSDGDNRESRVFHQFDTSTVDKQPENMDYGDLAAEVTYRTTKKVLLKLRKIDYASSIAKDLDIDKTTATYHIEKLVYLGLVQKYGDRPDRTLYKITEKGEMILDMVNTPE